MSIYIYIFNKNPKVLPKGNPVESHYSKGSSGFLALKTLRAVL